MKALLDLQVFLVTGV